MARRKRIVNFGVIGLGMGRGHLHLKRRRKCLADNTDINGLNLFNLCASRSASQNGASITQNSGPFRRSSKFNIRIENSVDTG